MASRWTLDVNASLGRALCRALGFTCSDPHQLNAHLYFLRSRYLTWSAPLPAPGFPVGRVKTQRGDGSEEKWPSGSEWDGESGARDCNARAAWASRDALPNF